MTTDRIHIEVEPDHWAPIPEALIFAPDVSANAKVLWTALRRYGQEPSDCHPSVRTLANRLGVATRSIRRWCEELEETGWLTRVERFDDGRQIPNGYVVRRTPATVGEDSGVRGGRTSESGTRRTEESGEEREPEEREPYNETDLQENTTPVLVLDNEFETFWATYPRRTGKGAARTAFAKARAKVSLDRILTGATEFREDPNREEEFTPHPATWLNQERWEDDRLPARRHPAARRRGRGDGAQAVLADIAAQNDPALAAALAAARSGRGLAGWVEQQTIDTTAKEHTNGDTRNDRSLPGEAERERDHSEVR